MPFPVQGNTAYVTKHGFGYSVFEHSETGIVSDALIFTDTEQPIKFVIINIHNTSGRERKISLTGYSEWVLGDLRSKSAMHVVTDHDNNTGALIACNPYNFEFEHRVAFLTPMKQIKPSLQIAPSLSGGTIRSKSGSDETGLAVGKIWSRS